MRAFKYFSLSLQACLIIVALSCNVSEGLGIVTVNDEREHLNSLSYSGLTKVYIRILC